MRLIITFFLFTFFIFFLIYNRYRDQGSKDESVLNQSVTDDSDKKIGLSGILGSSFLSSSDYLSHYDYSPTSVSTSSILDDDDDNYSTASSSLSTNSTSGFG